MPRTTRALLGALALLVTAAPMAHAQLGGLMKKAAKAAASKVVDRTADRDADKAAGGGTGLRHATADAASYGEPFTEETLAAMLRGGEAALALRTQLAQLEPQLAAASARQADLMTPARSAESSRYSNAESAWQLCRDSLANAKERAAANQPDVAKVAAMGPKVMELSQRMLAAEQRGDTIMVSRLAQELQELRGVKVSDAEARAACGAPPTKPAWLAEYQRAMEESNALRKKRQDLEQRAGGEFSRSSSLGERRFALARERLMLWLGLKSDGRERTFGAEERALLERESVRVEKLADVIRMGR